MGSTTIVPLVTHTRGNVSLGSDKPAGAADNSDVLAAATLCSLPVAQAQSLLETGAGVGCCSCTQAHSAAESG